jgi:hypothetical protein
MNRMDAIAGEINQGAIVCARLKIIYFNQVPWIECYRDVANKFTTLKKIMREFYSQNDKEIIPMLIKYSEEDIMEAFNTAELMFHKEQEATNEPI